MQFVTDRTEEDVLLGNAKGEYTCEDLNRVEQAVSELATLVLCLDIRLDLTVKTNWGAPGSFTAEDWPAESQMHRYLHNVHALCDAVSVAHGAVPQAMDRLTWEGANAIEDALHFAYLRVLGVIQTFRYSGEFYAGEESYS